MARTPRDVLRRMLYEYLSKKDPRRCHSGEIGTLVRECATQEDTHRVLAKLAEEFGDGNFPLPPLPDVEQAPLEIADGALKQFESGLSTKKDSSHHYGYGSRYRDANTSDAVSALLARRGASAAMDIRASLGHVGLNWTPKRHGTVSPALAERIKVALLCAVRDRKRPHKERSLALLPNRILIHNIFSYLADVNSVRINGSLLRRDAAERRVPRGSFEGCVARLPPGHGEEVRRAALQARGLAHRLPGQIYCGEGARVAGDRPQARLDQARDAAAGGTGEPLRRLPATPLLPYAHEQRRLAGAALDADRDARARVGRRRRVRAGGGPELDPRGHAAGLSRGAARQAHEGGAAPRDPRSGAAVGHGSDGPVAAGHVLDDAAPVPAARAGLDDRPSPVRKSTSASGRPGGIIYYSGRLDAARECLVSSHDAS